MLYHFIHPSIRQSIHPFIKPSIHSSIHPSIQVPTIYIDSSFYGQFVFSPLNIILYNVFGKGGPELYGTEPWTYYFANGFLNFNVVFLLALMSWILIEYEVIN